VDFDFAGTKSLVNLGGMNHGILSRGRR
jgi:hypothetical protein